MEESVPSSPRDRFRIEIKVSRDQKELIRRGAEASKQGVSEFVRLAAEQAAKEALRNR